MAQHVKSGPDTSKEMVQRTLANVLGIQDSAKSEHRLLRHAHATPLLQITKSPPQYYLLIKIRLRHASILAGPLPALLNIRQHPEIEGALPVDVAFLGRSDVFQPIMYIMSERWEQGDSV